MLRLTKEVLVSLEPTTIPAVTPERPSAACTGSSEPREASQDAEEQEAPLKAIQAR